MQPSDEKLMQKVKDGDMRSFDVLVRRWEDRLFNLIYKIIGDFEAAKDIRQEVFLRIYQSAWRYRPHNHFKAWLYRIAVNCSINELRKRERHSILSIDVSYQHDDGQEKPLESVLADSNPKPDEALQQSEVIEHVQNALRRLSNEQRVVIVLRHYEGLKFHQIASVLDCPVGTVKSRMHHGLERLRMMLKDYCWEGEIKHGL